MPGSLDADEAVSSGAYVPQQRPLTAVSPCPAATTDHELLERCREGDDDAWDAIVGRYERLVFSVALRNGLGPEDAADVTQSTFVALLDAIDQVRADDRLAWWLMTVARRQAWRWRQRDDREHESFEFHASSDSIEEWERLAWIYDGLQQMSAPCRDLLIALYFDPSGPSYAEVAERFGHAIGTIGPLRARCLEHLRNILGEPPDH